VHPEDHYSTHTHTHTRDLNQHKQDPGTAHIGVSAHKKVCGKSCTKLYANEGIALCTFGRVIRQAEFSDHWRICDSSINNVKLERLLRDAQRCEWWAVRRVKVPFLTYP